MTSLPGASPVSTMSSLAVALLLLMLASGAARADSVTISDSSRLLPVVVRADAGEQERFAASELVRYLGQMTGRRPEVVSSMPPSGGIVLSVDSGLASSSDSYRLSIDGGSLRLTGASGRGLIYAVYDLLERLGCRWLAPGFDFYSGESEVVPRRTRLTLALARDVTERPVFGWRKLYVEEGRSHDQQNLLQLVDWMGKARFNVLVVPTDYQGQGRVRWDNWRERLAPELVRRGITIEVGGHGYQNFLSASGDGGRLWREHQDWFGQDAEGWRREEERFVFCTSNDEAVAHVAEGVTRYLRERPEIQVFDLWPPDGGVWCECDRCRSLGTPSDRQSRLMGQVASSVRDAGLGVRLECIAYSQYVEPPSSPKLPPDVLVDFCPISQCFERQIYESGQGANSGYRAALVRWTREFGGEVSLYSYYRKYAWRSLPAMLPHYMQRDMLWYASIGLSGISCYSEPGDWRAYEANHYALAKLAWDPRTDVDALLEDYCAARYGRAAAQARKLLSEMEDCVRMGASIPGTSLKSPEALSGYVARLESARSALEAARPHSAAVEALLASSRYAILDLELQRHRSLGGDPAERRKLADALTDYLEQVEGLGVVVDRGTQRGERLYSIYGASAGGR